MLGRTLRWIREQFFFLIVLGGLLASLAFLIVEPNRWRAGTVVVCASALLAGVFRLVLPVGLVGLLAVRGRWTDSAYFLLLGGLILAVDLRLHS